MCKLSHKFSPLRFEYSFLSCKLDLTFGRLCLHRCELCPQHQRPASRAKWLRALAFAFAQGSFMFGNAKIGRPAFFLSLLLRSAFHSSSWQLLRQPKADGESLQKRQGTAHRSKGVGHSQQLLVAMLLAETMVLQILQCNGVVGLQRFVSMPKQPSTTTSHVDRSDSKSLGIRLVGVTATPSFRVSRKRTSNCDGPEAMRIEPHSEGSQRDHCPASCGIVLSVSS